MHLKQTLRSLNKRSNQSSLKQTIYTISSNLKALRMPILLNQMLIKQVFQTTLLPKIQEQTQKALLMQFRKK